MWLDYLVTGLAGYGWQATAGLVAGRWHAIERYVASYPDMPFVSISNRTGSAEGRQRALMEAVRDHRPDVVVGVNIVDLYPACRRLRYQGEDWFRTVMALHGIVPDLIGDLERERDAIDAVVATNRLACRLSSELGGKEPGEVHYAPYGVDSAGLSGIGERRRGKQPLRIAYAGRLDRAQKRVHAILGILRHLEERNVDFRIEVAGDGPEKENLGEGLKPWLEDGRACMLGPVVKNDMPRLYGRSDALLVTSRWETGPIVIWEAMAAGLPVVTSRYVGSGLEGALEHEENCLMYPVGDAKQAAAQLQRLTDPALVKHLTAAGKRLVRERYSTESSVQAWAEALDSIVESEKAAAVPSPRPPGPAGRLDRFLGTSLAESVRRKLGISFAHGSAGGEWPHSLTGRCREREFHRIAARADGL